MDNPEASYAQLRHAAASPRCQRVVRQWSNVWSRVERSCCAQLLQEAVKKRLERSERTGVAWRRFNVVYVQDGTIISRPIGVARRMGAAGGGKTPERDSRACGPRYGAGSGPGRDARAHGSRGTSSRTQWRGARCTITPQGCLYNVDARAISPEERCERTARRVATGRRQRTPGPC